MVWFALAPYVAVILVAVMVPGICIGLVLRLRGWSLVGIAPALSVSVVGLAAIGGEAVGLSWGWVPITALTAILCLIVWGLVQAGVRFLPALFQLVVDPEMDSETPKSRLFSVAVPATALLAASSLATWRFTQMILAPERFSQTFDNIFHMNAVRWTLDTGYSSSLFMHSMTPGVDPHGFYPMAWHNLVSLANLTLNSVNIPYGSNAMMLVLVTVIWPLTSLFLVSRLFPKASAALTILSGILASSFASFPWLLLGFGVLYPNALGFSLLPVSLGLAFSLLNILPQGERVPVGLTILTLVGCLPGLFLAHPNAVLSLMAMISPLVILWAWRGVKATWTKNRKQARPYIVTTASTLIIFAGIWGLSLVRSTYKPPNSLGTTLSEILSASPLVIAPFWLLAALIIAGIAWMIRDSGIRWWFYPTIVVCFLWYAASAMPHGFLRKITVGGYYADPHRLGALLTMVLFPITVMGIQSFITVGSFILKRFPKINTPLIKALCLVLAGIGLIVGIQNTSAMTSHIGWVRWHYQLDSGSLISIDEYSVIKQIPNIISQGERVATNPWTASSLVYALSGVPVTLTHITGDTSDDLEIIKNSLREAQTNPRVCPAVRALNIGYVLQFPNKVAHTNYVGLENLDEAEGFTAVARVGEAVFFRIDACQ